MENSERRDFSWAHATNMQSLLLQGGSRDCAVGQRRATHHDDGAGRSASLSRGSGSLDSLESLLSLRSLVLRRESGRSGPVCVATPGEGSARGLLYRRPPPPPPLWQQSRSRSRRERSIGSSGSTTPLKSAADAPRVEPDGEGQHRMCWSPRAPCGTGVITWWWL